LTEDDATKIKGTDNPAGAVEEVKMRKLLLK
jgi:hypothetical protein